MRRRRLIVKPDTPYFPWQNSSTRKGFLLISSIRLSRISNPNIRIRSEFWLLGPFHQPRFMSDLDNQIPTTFDPFADANAEDSGAGTKEYVHIRIQQRNGRKSLTTVQGLKKEFSYNKILKDLKKEFCCNGTVVQDPELGQVIQLQGDQRKNVSTFLVQAGIVKKEHIKMHGF
ncbi:hypothetical protein Patl1_04306 [Pistacia atlantica]|uniref:Uncharacterized protein n=1 Tax=Pistacia atlantica TaxID=434234 RepID=A0ACC1BRK5_9ROSI|nr:hypothetical protein Patl1_04306 [Pistacia atlantica]